MIVYVESNFILEIAYQQEEHASCDELLSLADGGSVLLALPASSIIEVKLSLRRRANRRERFHHRLKRELRELSRSKPYEDLARGIQPLLTSLIESVEEQRKRLEATLARLHGRCEFVALHKNTLQRAALLESGVMPSPMDAMVLASVIEDLSTRPPGPKCFLNRNSRDFARPEIHQELNNYGCKLIPSFTYGLAYVKGVLARSSNSDQPSGA